MKKVLSMLLLAALVSAVTVLPLQAQRRTTDEYDRRVYVINARSSPMMRLYAARSTTSGWWSAGPQLPARSSARQWKKAVPRGGSLRRALGAWVSTVSSGIVVGLWSRAML